MTPRASAAVCSASAILLLFSGSAPAAAELALPDSMKKERPAGVAAPPALPGEPGPSISLRDDPDRKPEWFLVSDVGVAWRLNDGREEGDDDHAYRTLEFGLMRYSEGARLGFGLFAGFAPDRERIGIEGMIRTRYTRSTSLQISYGLLLDGDNTSVNVDFPGATLQVELRYLDLLSASIRGEAVRIETPKSRQTDVAWFLGVKAGSYAGLGAAVLLSLGAMAGL